MNSSNRNSEWINPMVTFNSGETNSSILSGFSIGSQLQRPGTSSDIVIESSAPTLDNIHFLNSMKTFTDQSKGYSIYLENSDAILNNVVIHNTSISSSSSSGYSGSGAIHVMGGAPTFNNLAMSENSITKGGTGSFDMRGGLMYVEDSANVTIHSSSFTNNTMSYEDQDIRGGAIYIDSSHVTIHTSHFTGNASSTSGASEGAIVYGDEKSHVELTNVIISGNSSISGDNKNNDIIHFNQSGNLVLEETIVRDNTGTGIFINGNMTTEGSVISANNNGGITGAGALNLSSTNLDSNITENNGGAIQFAGTVITNDIKVRGNDAAKGGGIHLIGSLTSDSSLFSGNSASNTGGGLWVSGNAALSYSNLMNNHAEGEVLNRSNTRDELYEMYFYITDPYGIGGAGGSIVDQNGNVWESWDIGDYGQTLYLELNLPPGTYTLSLSTSGYQYGTGNIRYYFGFIETGMSLYSGYGDNSNFTWSLGTETELPEPDLSDGAGGGIYVSGLFNAEECAIESNQSVLGGGVYVSGSLDINKTTIVGNNTSSKAGGIWLNGLGSIDSSHVLSNLAQEFGGGVFGNGTLNITFSELNENTSLSDGGGLYWNSGQLTVERSDIRKNQAYRGGGTFILAENPIFQFNVISHNNATTIGGGMYISKLGDVSSTPIIFNSTVVYNTSAVLGSGLLCTNQTNPVVQNSIFWGNLAADGVQMHLQGSSEIFVTYSDVAGGESGIVGFDDIIYQNNIDVFPDFVDAENEQYSLLITSPCIDAGNPNAPQDPDGTVPDMGAYYFAQDGIPNIDTEIILLEFSGVALNENKIMELPIQNQGLSDLIVTGLSFSNDAFSTSDSSFTVPSLETYDVNITFTPLEEGIQNGTITFTNNDPDEESFSVNLHGAGDGLAVNSIEDIPNDQGGMVGISWHRNVFDGIDDSETILHYNVWRRYDNTRNTLTDSSVTMLWTPLPREVRDTDTWELVGSTPSLEFENYAFSAGTWFDSVDYDIPWTVFLVSAHTDDPDIFYVSDPDSGYSVDNIAPEFNSGLYFTYGEGLVNLFYDVEGNEDVFLYEVKKDGEPYLETENTFFSDSATIGETISYEIRGTDENGNVGAWSDPIVVSYGSAGDVTWDNQIDILDVIRVSYIILHPSEEFTNEEIWAADINQDELISVGDVPPLVDIIMGGSLSETTYEPGMVHLYRDGQTLFLDAEIPVAGIQFAFNQSGSVTNLSNMESSFHENLGLMFTLSDAPLLGARIPILELSEGIEVQGIILVDNVGNPIQAMLDIVSEPIIPEVFAVHQNFPNPFNPVTTIQIDLDKSLFLDVSVFDIMGREIRNLSSEVREAGYHFIDWNGDNHLGNEVSSGTYFILVSTPESRKVIKAVYLR